MASFRTYVDAICPPWLRKPNGAKLMYSIGGVLFDALAEVTQQAIRARMPGYGTDTALDVIGRDRQILRGFAEPADAYAVRLQTWLDVWRIAGSPFAIMEAIKGYFSPVDITVRIVDNSGNWYTYREDGVKSFHRASPNNWDWDSNPSKWWRFWVIIYANDIATTGPDWGDADLWGGAWGTDGPYSWGMSGISSTQCADLRALVAFWKASGPYCENIIFAFDPLSFDPEAAPASPGMPDGTWDLDSNRLDTARYVDGSL